MTGRQIESITEDFYSRFCGVQLSRVRSGLHFVPSVERSKYLQAFACKYSIWVLIKDGLCVVSYSPDYAIQIEDIKRGGADDIIPALCLRFPLKEKRLFIFEREKLHDYGGAKALGPGDYRLYEEFFRKAYPGASPDGWLQDYFLEKARGGCFTGYLSGGRLLSVCDLPDMPYMQGTIQHTGINTLEDQRRKGYARCAAALAAHNLLENGICPQWECDADNIASIGLAKAIGYKEYGAAYIFEE